MEGKHVIHYFPLKAARALPIELALKLNEVEHEVVQLQLEKWADKKHDKDFCPFGRLPTLVLPEGEILTQTLAILYYISAKCNMLYDDALRNARVMEACLAMNEVYSTFGKTLSFPNTEERRVARTEAFEVIQTTLRQLDAHFARSMEEHAVGNKLTMADLFLVATEQFIHMPLWDFVPKDVFQQHQHVDAALKSAKKNKIVAAHLKSMGA